jgi:peptidoglycan-associated lipoprotein
MITKFSMALITGAALLLAACDKDVAPVAETSTATTTTAAAVDTATVSYFQQQVGDRVFFATNASSVTALGRQTLDRQAAWLNENAGVSAVIEGHADERGTREFNLALGARRAEASRAYLVSRGVSASRLTTISYGKERPTATCSSENCWAQNRRGVTVLSGAPTS